MLRGRPLRIVAISVAALVLLIAGALAANALGAPDVRSGPLAGQLAYQDGIPASVGDIVTWGVVLPAGPTGAPITLRSLEAVDPIGVEVLGIAIHDPGIDGAVGQHLGPVPGSVRAASPDGVILPAEGSASRLEVLITVRVAAGGGAIDGIRVRYVQDQNDYADVLPYSLRIIEATAPLTGH